MEKWYQRKTETKFKGSIRETFFHKNQVRSNINKVSVFFGLDFGVVKGIFVNRFELGDFLEVQRISFVFICKSVLRIDPSLFWILPLVCLGSKTRPCKDSKDVSELSIVYCIVHCPSAMNNEFGNLNKFSIRAQRNQCRDVAVAVDWWLFDASTHRDDYLDMYCMDWFTHVMLVQAITLTYHRRSPTVTFCCPFSPCRMPEQFIQIIINQQQTSTIALTWLSMDQLTPLLLAHLLKYGSTPPSRGAWVLIGEVQNIRSSTFDCFPSFDQ